MKPILVLYATREGHTRKIAERVAGSLEARGMPAKLVDVGGIEPAFALDEYRAVFLAASVHGGTHESEMVSFVKGHRHKLDALPTAFVSVSLTEAGAEDPQRPRAQREEASHAVETMLEAFYEQTGWHPLRVKPVAGALLYSHYGPVKRFIMKLIVKAQGGSTDTSRDHEYTDWSALERFVSEFVTALGPEPKSN